MHKGERLVLGDIYPHVILSKMAVSCQSFSIFPCRDCSGTGSDSLEIGIRNTACCFSKAQNSRPHSIPSCNVFRSAFQEVLGVLCEFLAKGDGVVVITSVGDSDQFYAAAEFFPEPEVMNAIQRDTNYHRDVIVRADLSKSTCSIAGRLDNQCPFFTTVHSGEDAISLSFLEGAGLHLCADLRIPPGESDI